jgi:uncharacterized protein (TIGR02453 family)
MIQQETLDFLSALRENNHKAWFDSKRSDYERARANALEFATSLLGEMASLDQSLQVLSAKDCMFRINRDVRFSNDKSPYKTHMGIVLTQGGKKSGLASYYVHIEAGNSFIGGGVWMPEAAALSRIRKEIHYEWKEFHTLLSKPSFQTNFGDLDREPEATLKKPPKGFASDDPGIEYLKLKSFTATQAISDTQLIHSNLLTETVAVFSALKPFLDFLSRGLMTGAND